MKKIHTFLSTLRELRGFLILWLGQSVSSLGSSMTSYALILWVYRQRGTAMSMTLLAFFSYLPSIAFSFIGGAFADRWDKKRTMLVSDLIAALGTVSVFFLYATGGLQVWHLYLVNFLLSFMGAFQGPASYVSVSLLVPKKHYARASGLQGLSSAAVQIATPALASAVFMLLGLEAVFIVDLSTFLFAFLTLLFLVRIPEGALERAAQKREAFFTSLKQGLRFLWGHKALFCLILYMALINLLAYTTGYGLLPAMVLKRSGGDEALYGFVSMAIGLGMLVGSLLVTLIKPARNKTRLIFITMAVSFGLGDILWGITRTGGWWIFSGFAGNVLVPFTNACMFIIMRTQVPTELQGRVFSARDTFQYFTIPLALLLSGALADYGLEPFMASSSGAARFFAGIVGEGPGSGMALIFVITGLVGVIVSLVLLKRPLFRALNRGSDE